MKHIFTRSFLMALGGVSILLFALFLKSPRFDYTSDVDMHKVVLQLEGNGGKCSGEQIETDSGHEYVLTAAHCKNLQEDGSIQVTTEDGRTLMRRIIAEDQYSDLMLLEPVPDMKGIKLASSWERNQHIRTFTHGGGLPTYKTEGELIASMHIDFELWMIDSLESEDLCSKPKHAVKSVRTFFGDFKICALSANEVATTAMTIPGSSGGMAVDDNGRLVGVVSAGGRNIGFLVPLEAIQDFLYNY